MKSLPALFIIPAAFLLTACGSTPTQFLPPLSAPPPPNAATPCPPLPAPDADMDMGGLLTSCVDVVNLYHQCQLRQQGMIDWSKK